MKQNERIANNTAAIIHNLMNHGYSEEHARILMGMMAELLLDLPQEMLEALKNVHEERMREHKPDIFGKLQKDIEKTDKEEK